MINLNNGTEHSPVCKTILATVIIHVCYEQLSEASERFKLPQTIL